MGEIRSNNMVDKPKFLKKYNNCDDEVKNLLDNMTQPLKDLFSNWGYTDTPDLRFSCAAREKELQFCKFELYPTDHKNPIRMFIRVDNLAYMPTLLKAGLAGNFFVSKRGFRGKQWIEARLSKDSRIQPFIQIVIELSKIRRDHGW